METPQEYSAEYPRSETQLPAVGAGTGQKFPQNIETSIRAKGPSLNGCSTSRSARPTSTIRTATTSGKSHGSCLLQPAMALFPTPCLFRKVREAFGGSLSSSRSGRRALLDSELQRFYAIGIPIFQGYGTLGSHTPSSRPTRQSTTGTSSGSSGKISGSARPGKNSDEEGPRAARRSKGEIVIRGENVMAGYWKIPDATAETVRDGWLHTGDMGYVSEDDFLCVGAFQEPADRLDGEKYSPEGMEEAIVDKSPLHRPDHPIHNNQSPFTGAIVVPKRKNGPEPRASEPRESPGPTGVRAEEAIPYHPRAEIPTVTRGYGPGAGEFPGAVVSGGLAIGTSHSPSKTD